MSYKDEETPSFDDVYIIAENKAQTSLLCRIEGREIWIPKNHITDDSEVWQKGQGPGKLVVTEWIALQTGLI